MVGYSWSLRHAVSLKTQFFANDNKYSPNKGYETNKIESIVNLCYFSVSYCKNSQFEKERRSKSGLGSGVIFYSFTIRGKSKMGWGLIE